MFSQNPLLKKILPLNKAGFLFVFSALYALMLLLPQTILFSALYSSEADWSAYFYYFLSVSILYGAYYQCHLPRKHLVLIGLIASIVGLHYTVSPWAAVRLPLYGALVLMIAKKFESIPFRIFFYSILFSSTWLFLREFGGPKENWLFAVLQVRIFSWVIFYQNDKSLLVFFRHCFDPQFLVFPLAFAWLSWDEFCENSRSEQNQRVATTHCLTYGGWSIFLFFLLYCLHEHGRNLISWAMNPEMLGNPAFLNHLAAGLLFFFNRYCTLAACSALVISLSATAGIVLRFEFYYPIFSKSFFDFWQRYQIFSREYLLKIIFFPCYFNARRRCGKLIATVFATALVALFLSVVNSMGFDPAIPTNYSLFSRWYYALHHTFVLLFFLFLSMALSKVFLLLRKLSSSTAWKFFLSSAERTFTLIFISGLFYSGFVNYYARKSFWSFLTLWLGF